MKDRHGKIAMISENQRAAPPEEKSVGTYVVMTFCEGQNIVATYLGKWVHRYGDYGLTEKRRSQKNCGHNKLLWIFETSNFFFV